jgi:hypothetical protein
VPRADLARPDLDELDWSDEQRSRSLSVVFAHAVGLAAGAEEWYASRRRAKRLWGRALRVTAICLGAVAAVLPILSQIFTSDDKAAIAPGWAAVALAAAAALVALDHYFGFSTGWSRFMAAELRLTRLRHQFEYDWQLARAANAAERSDEVAPLLVLAREFVLAVDDAISSETGAWIAEFQTSLDRAEEGLRRSDGT